MVVYICHTFLHFHGLNFVFFIFQGRICQQITHPGIKWLFTLKSKILYNTQRVNLQWSSNLSQVFCISQRMDSLKLIVFLDKCFSFLLFLVSWFLFFCTRSSSFFNPRCHIYRERLVIVVWLLCNLILFLGISWYCAFLFDMITTFHICHS